MLTPTFRHPAPAARRINAFVLAAYLLLIAAAGLVPWSGVSWASPVCSTSGQAGPADLDDDGSAPAQRVRCALCLPLQMSADPVVRFAVDVPPERRVPPVALPQFPERPRALMPPARGPPSV